jgi:hypothetical protein
MSRDNSAQHRTVCPHESAILLAGIAGRPAVEHHGRPNDTETVEAETLSRNCCLVSYVRAMRETCREPVHTGQGGRPRLRPGRHVLIAQVVKRDERRRGVDIERRIVDGTPARVETLRRRSQGTGGINTAYIERLKATFRERLASLTRRGRARARRTLTLQPGMYLIGTVYTFCTPHASLAPIRGGTTPAMAAGVTDHCWTVQELLSFPVPPSRWTPPTQRGRPSRALQRLGARWCS